MHTDVASRYLARGWWLVPIPAGAKGPTIRNWPKLRITNPADLDGGNVGIILGRASNLWCVDLDHPAARELAEQYLPPTGLVSGRPGNPRSHWFYRVVGEIKNAKHKLPSSKETVVEILGEGNQVVVGPSVHPSGDVYDVLDGEPAEVDGRELMDAVYGLWFAVVSQLGETPTVQANGKTSGKPVADCSPGTDYDERGDVRSLLVRHGWVPLHMSGDNEHWRRPGKSWGTSATLKDCKQFYVFTSSTCLDSQRCYGPFGLYAALEHGGDYAAAAAALRAEGYGESNRESVDLSSIVNQRLESSNGHCHAPAIDKFPFDCLQAPGFIADLVQFNLETASHPQPELALAGALALISVCVGNKVKSFCKHLTFPNLYVLGLAPTGAGKDHARRLNREILDAAGATEHRGNEMVGSSSGIIAELAKTPVVLFQIDEIADLLVTMKNASKSPYLYSVAPVLKQLYSAAGSVFRGPALANRDTVKTLSMPHCVIYGTTVPGGFWESVTAGQTVDGLLSRFSIFAADGYAKTADPEYREIPGRLVEFVRYWFERPAGAGNLADSMPQPGMIEHTPEAHARAARHADDINARQIEEYSMDPQRAALWSRTAEKTNKFALLFACSRTKLGDIPRIELCDVELAIRLSNWLTRRTLSMIQRHIGDSDWDSLVKRAKAKLNDGMSLRDAKRALRFLRPDQLRLVLQQLEQAEELAYEQSPSSGGRQAIIVRCLW